MNSYAYHGAAHRAEDRPAVIDLTGLATRDVAVTEITLTTANGVTLTGAGDAKRHPNDLPDPAYGADLATLRALRDLTRVFESTLEIRARQLIERQAELDAYRRAERDPAVMAPLFAVKVEPFDRKGLNRLLARVNESARHEAARVAADREYAGIREYAAGLKAAGVPREERLTAVDHYRRYFASDPGPVRPDGAVSVGFKRDVDGELVVDSIAEVAVQGAGFRPVDIPAEYLTRGAALADIMTEHIRAEAHRVATLEALALIELDDDLGASIATVSAHVATLAAVRDALNSSEEE